MSAPWLDRMLDRLHGVLDREARVVRSSATDTNSTKVKQHVQAVVAKVAADHVLSTATLEVRRTAAGLTGGQLGEATTILATLGITGGRIA